ncbi:phage morphogenesis protein [Campylobacter sp. RM9328]|uniref:phage morphogenesis protein n=1 Tax=Campylobacter sp. RM9328 TaxID=1705720 RepID=UPI001473B8D4|nr:phage morphogenesis protein [Campylobacter sp. RM9328]
MSIEIKGLEQIQAKLKTLEGSLSGAQIKVKLNTVGGMILNSIEKSFDDERSPFGERWKPISANTAFAYVGGRKKAYTKNGKTQRAGFLAKFGAKGSKRILWQSGNLATRWIVKSDSSSVTVSNNSSNKGFAYGLTHQFGSSKLNIPARAFLPIDSGGNLEKKLTKRINDYLSDEIIKTLK